MRPPKKLEQAAADAEAWLDSLDPAETPAEDASDLRRIGQATIQRAETEQEITAAVADARENGRTWGEIAIVLGVSKQAARERYGSMVELGS